jgi:hypothetical protein
MCSQQELDHDALEEDMALALSATAARPSMQAALGAKTEIM